MEQIAKNRIVKYKIKRIINFILFGITINLGWLSLYFVEGGFNRNISAIISVAGIVIFAVWGAKLGKEKEALGIKPLIFPPLDVKFEKTDDVSENIRRYKIAEGKALEKLKEEKLRSNWLSRFFGK